jgi:NADH-quinone oxidoreductase subunit G
MSDQIKLTIDGHEVEVPKGSTVMQAAKKLSIEVPHFCYHEKLSIAGNCRMCLVEVEGAPKPVASCHWPAADGMVVNTKSDVTEKAQKGTMEMLLINHPLDCPICDQGGECDLQDIAVGYGSDQSRFDEMKRAVDDKDLGTKIKTVMTRCIHCTRCVRFAEEIAGVEDMGATGRGENMKIGTYVEKTLSSELAGNMIDICPVGALTDKPYAFKARPWELVTTNSIDITDSLGSNIKVDSRAGDILRISPRENEAVNECWLADTGRWVWDAFQTNRIETPRMKGKSGAQRKTTWPQAFEAITTALKGKKAADIGVLIGDELPAEGLFAFKAWLDQQGVDSKNINAATDWNGFSPASRAHCTLNTPLAEFEEAEAVMLIGCDPRTEAPLLNQRIRKAWRKNNIPVGNIGAPVDLTYPTIQLSTKVSEMETFLKGKKPKANKPIMLIGREIQQRKDANAIIKKAAELAKELGIITADWNGFNVLPASAGRTAALDIFGAPAKSVEDVVSSKVLIVYGKPNAEIKAKKGQTIIYLGSHANDVSKQADVALPTALYVEQGSWWVNAEGRLQQAEQVVKPHAEAKEDWKIWRALSEQTGEALPFNTLNELRALMVRTLNYTVGECKTVEWVEPKGTGRILAAELEGVSDDLYQSTELLQNSNLMKNMRQELDASLKQKQEFKKAS